MSMSSGMTKNSKEGIENGAAYNQSYQEDESESRKQLVKVSHSPNLIQNVYVGVRLHCPFKRKHIKAHLYLLGVSMQATKMHYPQRMLSIMCNNIYITHHGDGHYCGDIVRAFSINTMGKWTLSEYLKLKKNAWWKT